MFPHNVRHNKLSPKASFLGHAHKNAANHLLALVSISSFSVAEKYVSENYFNTNNFVADLCIIVVYFSFCLCNINKIPSIEKTVYVLHAHLDSYGYEFRVTALLQSEKPRSLNEERHRLQIHGGVSGRWV